MFKGTNKASYSQDVLSDVKTILDTRGIPDFEKPLPSISLELPKCFLGNCTGLPDVKPPNQFTVYKTSFA